MSKIQAHCSFLSQEFIEARGFKNTPAPEWQSLQAHYKAAQEKEMKFKVN